MMMFMFDGNSCTIYGRLRIKFPLLWFAKKEKLNKPWSCYVNQPFQPAGGPTNTEHSAAMWSILILMKVYNLNTVESCSLVFGTFCSEA